ncbi:Acetyl-coenzyme A synthetase [subsurface metagenome]
MGKRVRNIRRALAYTNDLPKTRSGKIIRRILKFLVRNESVGDTMTLMNPESVEQLKEKVGYKG